MQLRPALCALTCAPLPAAGIVGGKQKESRSLGCCRLRAFTRQLYSNLRKNRAQFNYRHGSIYRQGRTISLQETSVCEDPLKSHVKCTEDLSRNQELRRSVRWQMVMPRTGTGTIGEEEGNAAWKAVAVPALGSLLTGALLFGVSSAEATDALKTCACLLKECRVELARCIANPGCAANVACLQTCNNRPDETECQIGCGDLFQNQVVDQFNECAVSRKGCVQQKKDEGVFPVPPPGALVTAFNTQDFSGKWYITSGLNKTFDTFDCQLHEFSPTPNTISAKLTWRVPTPDGGFFTRSGIQNFVQDTNQPGVLYNHGNEVLHYQDDWYILASKIEKSPDDFIFVYYRGRNDAWDGYGGAVVYTRSSSLPSGVIPELRSAAKTAGLDFNKFTTTNNTCGPEAPLLARLEKKVEEEGQYIEQEVEEEEMFLVKEVKLVVNTIGQFLASIVKGEVDLFRTGEAEFEREEQLFLKELGDEEKSLLDELKMGAKGIEQLFGKAIPVRRIR